MSIWVIYSPALYNSNGFSICESACTYHSGLFWILYPNSSGIIIQKSFNFIACNNQRRPISDNKWQKHAASLWKKKVFAFICSSLGKYSYFVKNYRITTMPAEANRSEPEWYDFNRCKRFILDPGLYFVISYLLLCFFSWIRLLRWRSGSVWMCHEMDQHGQGQGSTVDLGHSTRSLSVFFVYGTLFWANVLWFTENAKWNANNGMRLLWI